MPIKKSEQGKILVCPNCSESFTKKSYQQIYCSYKCQYTYINHKNQKRKVNNGFCGRCGESLQHKRVDAIYCSQTCKSMDHTLKHRSKTRFVSTARRYEIYLRDNKQCYQCAKELAKDEFELDHLIPIAKGGANNPENLAVSCLFCNRSRGTKIEEAQLTKLKELSQVD